MARRSLFLIPQNSGTANETGIDAAMVTDARISPDCPEIPIAADVASPHPELKKQITVLVPVSDFKRIRLYAAKLHVPMTELIRSWIDPQLKQLRRAGFHEHPLSLKRKS